MNNYERVVLQESKYVRVIPVSRVEVETRGYLGQQVLTGLKVEPGMYKQPVYYFGYRPHLYYGATGVDTVGKLGYLSGGGGGS